MAFKVFAAFTCCLALAVVSAAPTHHEHHGGSSHASFHLVSHDDHHDHHGHGHDDGHAEYHFKYGVEDKKTGDNKSQGEKRHGHKVEGFYELIDADGYKRIVHYTSDKHSGFHAVVTRVPIPHFVVDHGHTHYYGGHAEVKEEEHHGHAGHGHGYASGFSIKQEHAAPYHHKEH